MAETKNTSDQATQETVLTTVENRVTRSEEEIHRLARDFHRLLMLANEVREVMMRRGPLVVVLGLMAFSLTGCGTDHEKQTISIIAPTGKTQPAPSAPNAPSAPVSVGPTVQGTWFRIEPLSCLAPCTWKWRVIVTNAPEEMHFIALSHHNDKTSTEMTNDRPGPNFRIDGPVDFRKGQDGVFVASFDTTDFTCGRVQLDLAYVTASGVPVNILGVVYPYLKDCEGPETQTPTPPSEPPSEPPSCPDCTVTPTCPNCAPDPPNCDDPSCRPTLPETLAWQADLFCGSWPVWKGIDTLEEYTIAGYRVLASAGSDDSHETPTTNMRHKDVCGDVFVVDADVLGPSAYIQIDDPHPSLIVTLVMFKKNGKSWVPQAYVDQDSMAITAPGRYSFLVKFPARGGQTP